jgi:predicted permease
MQTLFQDIRYGGRMLRKNVGVTVIVIIALALGIGANTAIFSVVNAVLLQPLPYPESDRLMFLSETTETQDEISVAYMNFTDWRAQNQVFDKLAVYNRVSYNLTGAGDAERMLVAQTSADLFPILHVNAAIGRVFTNEEDKPGAAPVVVLSHALWQRRFGGQESIVGQSIILNTRSYTVIGVMPADFFFPSRAEMWVPVGQLGGELAYQSRGNHPGLYGVGRLKPGVTPEQAHADLNRIAANLAQQFPDSNSGNGVKVQPLLEIFVSGVRRALWVIFAAVGFVLLIACANIANLLLARATGRRKEMAIRAAMGASRWRVARQLLTESILLSLVGGSLGLLMARWGITLILYVSPSAIPRSREIGLNWTVLLFTVGVSFITGIIFGLLPALQSSQVDVQETLKETGRGASGRNWLRSTLVVVEVGTTLVLLIGAGLLIRSFYQLQQVNPGFSHEQVTSFSVNLPAKKYESPDQRMQFFSRLLENLRSVPGVESAAATTGLPLGYNGWQTSFIVVGQPVPPPSQVPSMEATVVSPDYFKTMNIQVLRGRVFNDRDDRSHLAGRDLSKVRKELVDSVGVNAIVIDEEFARHYWPNEDAVGKQVRLGGSDPENPLLTVLGVVRRVKMEGLAQDTNRVQGYMAFAQRPSANMMLVVKTSTDPNQLVGSLREAVQSIDREQPIYGIRTLSEIRSESVAGERLNLTLLSLFAGIALLLAVVGIYGVMSYSVTQRTHEIGIRMAIGARPADVFKMVLGHGMKLAFIGVGLGLIGAFALTRLMATMLFEVKPTDATTFGIISGLLILVAVLACYLPGRRATKVEPTVSLRYE